MSFVVDTIEFVTPEVSYPDVDSDLAEHPITHYDRDTVIDYLASQYGDDCIAYVGNRNYYSLKSALSGLGQVYAIPAKETIAASKELNPDISLEENMRQSQAVADYFGKYPELLEKVQDIAGTISSNSIHAGGVVLSDPRKPLRGFCALQRPAEGKRVATHWTKKEVAKIGLIKYDILGVSSLAHIHYARELIGLDPYEDAPEEQEVFDDICDNVKHKNIFQFESSLGRQALIDLRPTSVSELANASGIIRVLGTAAGRNVYETYKYNVHHRDEWEQSIKAQVYDDHTYEVACRVLADSYGVLIYQEQIANIVKYLSNEQKSFTDGNNFRKFLDKHKEKYGTIDNCQGSKEAVQAWHKHFMEGLEEFILPYAGNDGWDCPDETVQGFLKCEFDEDNRIPVPTTGLIGWVISAAAYLFSKLHAVAYSVNTYNMMWLKHYYPRQFWTAALTSEVSDLDKITSFITAIWSENFDDIQILPPDINKSDVVFLQEGDDGIRYALSAIQGLGKSAELIIAERQHGEYTSIKNFLERVNRTKVNKRVIYNLMFAGAFSQFGDIDHVIHELADLGVEFEFEDVLDDSHIAEFESKILGVNITHVHPIMKKAGQYERIDDLQDGSTSMCAIKILKTTPKTTVKGKAYSFYSCVCLNSGKAFNLFDWGNQGFAEGYRILNIKFENNFYSVAGGNGFDKRKFLANKAKLRKALKK